MAVNLPKTDALGSSKRITVLGSTGSVGTSTLDLVARNPEKFSVEALTANQNVESLASQAREFDAKLAVIADEDRYEDLKSALSGTSIACAAGPEALKEAAARPSELVMAAIVGAAGLAPTLEAVQRGTTVALANKECLVSAGDIFTQAVTDHGAILLPVDSEHSAIYQCLAGEFHNPIEKIVLTASGGPFRGFNSEQLKAVTKAQALKHPNWDMGAKITIDSASMMNKGLEVIEAKWLFDLNADQIEIVVHPQSIIHSIVQFTDGSMKAQLGLPDMKLPIQYALTYPHRLKNSFPRFDFLDYPSLTFEKPDFSAFRNLQLAYDSLEKGGNSPAILNAANEVAVARFLKDEIQFHQLPDVVEHALKNVEYEKSTTLDALVASDLEARKIAAEYK